MIYGLVAPGYEMAEIVAANLTGDDRHFGGAESFDQAETNGCRCRQLRQTMNRQRTSNATGFEDPFAGIYKKLLFATMARGCWAAFWSAMRPIYGKLLDAWPKAKLPLPCQPHELIGRQIHGRRHWQRLDAMPDAAQICSCNNVSKAAICTAIRDQKRRHARCREATARKPAPVAAAACRW